MKKILCLILATVALISTFFAVQIQAFSGSGIEVVSKDIKITKTALKGEKINISDSDFKKAFCINDFDKIEVTKLPKTSEGILLKGSRRVKLNEEIKRKNIASLVFVPASNEVLDACFNFKIFGSGTECEYTFRLRFVDKMNYAPTCKEEGDSLLTLTTQEEIGIFGKLAGSDKDGDKIEFVVVSYPKNGTVKMQNKEKGLYKYIPDADFTGFDKFVYVVLDEYGNYSYPETVTVKITERMSEKVFADMVDREEYNSAVAMDAMGVMSSDLIGDDYYFNPDKPVTRAEFVAMAMKACGIRKNAMLHNSFFDDNDKIPLSLTSYIATAQKLNLISGEFRNGKLLFRPNDKITKCECAFILSKIIGGESGEEEETLFEEEGVPVWARGSVLAMQTLGIFDTDKDLNLLSGITKADCAEYLYRSAKYAKR